MRSRHLRAVGLAAVLATASWAADLQTDFERATADAGFVVLQPGGKKPTLVPLTSFVSAKTNPAGVAALAPTPAPADLTPSALQRAAGVAFALGIQRLCVPTIVVAGKELPATTQPYWPMCQELQQTTARIAAVLSQGEPVVDVAVLAWDGAPALEDIAQQLARNQIDFDFVDPPSLAGAGIDGNAIVIGGATYTRLVLPPMTTIKPAALDKLEAFVKAGGVVVAIRELPGGDAATRIQQIFGVAPGSEVKQEIRNKGTAYFVKRDIGRAAAVLRNMGPDFFLYPPSRDVLYCHRRVGDTNVYFATNQSKDACQTYATIRRSGEPEIWDPETGRTRVAHGYGPQDGNVIVPLVLRPYQSILIVFRRLIDERRIRLAPGLAQLTAERNNGKLLARGLAGMNGAYTIVTADGRRGRAEVQGLPEPLDVTGPWQFRTEKPYDREASSIVVVRCRATKAGDDTSNWMKADYDDHAWDEIKIGEPLPSLQAQWHGHWLTFTGDNEDRRFRRTFELPEKPKEALVAITADNGYELYVNGEKTGADGQWEQAEVYTVTDKLKQGKNVIAVRATNQGGIAALLVEARITLASGKVERIVTDGTWKMTREAADGWQSVGFDDSKWGAPDVGEMPPCAPWGNVPGLPPEPQTGAELWYRFDLPPGASRIRLPESARQPRLFVNGKPVKVRGNVADLTSVPVAQRTKAALVISGPEPLQPPVLADCEAGAILPGSWTTQGFSKYSGIGTYWRSMKIPREYAKEHLFLDMGEVGCAAKVLVNGKECGVRAYPPYRFDISKAVKKGDNQIKVFVANTLANANGQPDTPSGLLGPVRLVAYRDVEVEVK